MFEGQMSLFGDLFEAPVVSKKEEKKEKKNSKKENKPAAAVKTAHPLRHICGKKFTQENRPSVRKREAREPIRNLNGRDSTLWSSLPFG